MSSTIPQNTLDTPRHTPPPLRQGTTHLTRDQRRDIRLMHDLHHSDTEIIQRFTITQRQLNYTIQAARPTPRKHTGRHCKLKDLCYTPSRSRRAKLCQVGTGTWCWVVTSIACN